MCFSVMPRTASSKGLMDISYINSRLYQWGCAAKRAMAPVGLFTSFFYFFLHSMLENHIFTHTDKVNLCGENWNDEGK